MAGRNVNEAAAAVEALDLNALLAGIREESVRHAIVELMNAIELLARENRALREANQRLTDELNRLKGQSPRPSGTGGKGGGGSKRREDISSEKDRQTPKTWTKSSKQHRIHIDRQRAHS